MNPNGWAPTLTTLAAVVLGAIGVSVDTSTQVQAVIAAGVALVVAAHGLFAHLTKKSNNAAAVAVSKARATQAVAGAVGPSTGISPPVGNPITVTKVTP